MVTMVRSVKVFISSPGNMVEERQIVRDTCEQINRDLGNRHQFSIEPLMWETHSSSSRSDRSQGVLNEQLADYDIYLGIMGFYFGSSTGVFESGTQEEFEMALEQNTLNGIPLLQFYFSKAKIDPSLLNIHQFEKVKLFKSRVGDSGILYREFESLTDFQVAVRSALTEQVLSLIDGKDVAVPRPKWQVGDAGAYPFESKYDSLKSFHAVISKNSFVAARFFIKKSLYSINEFTGNLKTLTSAMDSFKKKINRVAQESNRIKNGKPRSTASLDKYIEQMISSFEDVVDIFIERVPALEESFMETISYFQRAGIILNAEDDTERDGVLSSLIALADLRTQINDLKISLNEIAATLPEQKELGGRWESSRLMFVALIQDLSEFLTRASNVITQVDDLLKR